MIDGGAGRDRSSPAPEPNGSLAVDPATSGTKARLALLYHSMSPSHICDPTARCPWHRRQDGHFDQRRPVMDGAPKAERDLHAAVLDGRHVAGAHARRLLLRLMGARRPIAVFSLAFEPVGELYRQSIFATTRLR
jgi:hypothetical protein